MNNLDRKDFDTALTNLAALYDKELSEPVLDLYFDALADLPLAAIHEAFRRAVATAKFFPKPVEIRESIEGSGDDRANQAWASFLSAAADGGNASVKFLDPATALAVDATFGSWIEACNELRESDPPMVAHHRKNFIQAYQTARRFPREVDTYKIGRFEWQNKGGGWQTLDTYRGPVLLIGMRESKELRLPFDAKTGELVAEARALLDVADTTAGARRLMDYAKAGGAQTALGHGVPRRALGESSEPVSHGEAKRIIAEVQNKTGLSIVPKQIAAEAEEESEAA